MTNRFTIEKKYWKTLPQGDYIKDNLTGESEFGLDRFCEIANELQKENKQLKNRLNELLTDNTKQKKVLNNCMKENKELKERVKDWHQRTFKAHEYFNILEQVIDEVCNDDISNQIWKEYEKREKLVE